ncbi:TPA: TonB-dependent siderophore receptor PirA [Pseudomonas aeruginosa]
MYPQFRRGHLAAAVLFASSSLLGGQALAEDEHLEELDERAESVVQLGDEVVLGTAEQELKQAPGVSIITAEDIRKRPPVNDLSEIIRTMPGVNLTGNSSSGQRGNNRQIDIRGMGPENTLILVDGKPVSSRNSVRYGWRGERDTRGDSNWVPPEEVERIEVLRGPAAARYGSGAAGGVVNIITKRPTDRLRGSMTVFTNIPESSKDGATRRANFSLSGPLTEALSFRAYGSANKTDSDDTDINLGHTVNPSRTVAGREGVRNRDLSGMLSWQVTPDQVVDFEAGFSRQGNIYAGDTQNNNGTANTQGLADDGAETNRMYRENYAITHNGTWSFGTSRFVAQYDSTRNNRLEEGLAGSVEGQIGADRSFSTSKLENYRLSGELNLPLHALFEQVLTVGAEWNKETLNDPSSLKQGFVGSDSLPGTPAAGSRSPKSKAEIRALYVEDNIELRPGTMLTPGLRLDDHSDFGLNWSPSLNASQTLGEYFTVKAGIARAFKAPNLYQSNPNYLLYTRGNGCPIQTSSGGCYLVGNENLDAETSVNKELGIEFRRDGWVAGLTYFRNDYKNKIVAPLDVMGQTGTGNNILQWSNAKKAVVEGLEGNLLVPLHEDLSWSTNLTYMLQSKDKDTGNPLSVIPEYTLNSTLDWQASERLSTQLTSTIYGRQEPPKHGTSRNTPVVSRKEVGTYGIWGVSAGYTFSENLSVRGGVSNLFDKRLYRQGNSFDAGAATYNEPGRAYYVSMTTSF